MDWKTSWLTTHLTLRVGPARGSYVMPVLFDPAVRSARQDQAGLVMGYAGLDARRIERGVQLLQEAVRRMDASS